MTEADPVDAAKKTPVTRFRRAAVAGRGVVRELGPAIEAPGTNPFAGLEFENPLRSRRRWRAGRIPIRTQTQATDCGPACLAMVLAYHGIERSVDDLRRQTNAGRDGVSARTLLDVARRHGLAGRGVRTTLDGLASLPRGSVLFWNFGHFVVLERVTHRYVHVVDPAYGRRRVPLAVADDSFTGVALEFPEPLVRRRSVTSLAQYEHWRYLAYFFPRSRAWLPLMLTSMALLGANLVVPAATALVARAVVPGRDIAGLPFLTAGVAVLVVAFLLLQVIRMLAMLTLQTVSDKRVTLGILHRLLSLPYDFLTSRSPGDLALRVRTSTVVRQVLTNSAMSAMFDGVLILVYMGLLLFGDFALALVVIAFALAQVAALVLAWRRQESLTADALEAQSRSQGELVELLEGLAGLKAGGMEGTAGERWSHSFADEVNTRVRTRRHVALCSGVSLCLQFAAPLVVLLVGAARVGSGALDLGSVFAFCTLAMGLFVALANLVQTGLQVAGLGPNLARMGDILRAEPENDGELQVPTAVVGAVEMAGVGYAYAGAAKPVLRDVDVTIRPGEFVAVLGASGSGKSTLVAMLAGLVLPTTGAVRIDDVPTSRLDRSALRSLISFVNQDTRLFAGTIQDNIRCGQPTASWSDVLDAARLAGVHDEVLAMPMRYATLLASGGVGLSGGQRQRIVLARALLRRPRLIVLDEATSALDPDLERRIFANLLGLGATLVVVAHRLTTLAQADQVLIVEDGAVTRHEDGKPLSAERGRLLWSTERTEPA
jgi:ATP-binding cassette subfamily B protein